MFQMREEIYRKKSLDKIKSPDILDDYIRVSSPGVWILLACAILLLLGACVWGVFGRVESTVPAVVYAENGTAVCFLAADNAADVAVGMRVKFGEQEATIDSIGEQKAAGYTCTLTVDSAPADGVYDGTVVIRSYQPLSFIMN